MIIATSAVSLGPLLLAISADSVKVFKCFEQVAVFVAT